MPLTCAACLKLIATANGAIKCVKCKEHYHDLCVGLTENTKKSRQSTWNCPTCCNKTPKSDNTNKKIINDTSPSPDNVTRRRRVGGPGDLQAELLTISRDDLSYIVRKEIREAIDENITTIIQSCMQAQFKSMNSKIEDIENSMSFLNDQFEDFRKEISVIKPAYTALAEENKLIKMALSDLTSRLNQLEQQSRLCNLEIQCVPEFKTENVLGLVQQLGRVIEHPVQECDIIQCTRIAKADPTSDRPRSVLVKFTTARLRDGFLTASRNFNKRIGNDKLNTSHLGIASESKPKIYVNEHLTKEIRALHVAARLRAKELGYLYAWVRNGRIYMRKSEGEKYIYVKDLDLLKNLQ